MMRRRPLWFPLGLLLLLSGCGIHGLHVPQSPLLRLFIGSSGHIAYIGSDGNLYIAQQSGAVTQLTKDADSTSGLHVSYISPTWGPNGRRLAYARYVADPTNGSSSVEFRILDWKTRKDIVAFSSKTLKPFYFDWSPNGRQVAILSDLGGTLQFGIVDAGAPDSYHKLDTGSPYYWTWTPNGSELVTHTDFSPSGGGRLSLVSYGNQPKTIDLSDHLALFQAPSVLPDGRIVSVVGSAGSAQLAFVDPSTGRTVPFGPKVHGPGFLFSLSPNGRELAYLEAQESNGRAIEVLHVREVGNGKELLALDKLSTVGYYWSPNGSRIAFYTPAPRQKLDAGFAQVSSLPLLTVRVVDVRSGRTWKVATFPPTQSLLSTLPFIDQYQHSQTIWSPNDRYLLFTAYTNKGLPGVFVADASGNITPTKIADGDSAVWSRK